MSYSEPYRIVIIFTLFVILLSETQFTGAPARTVALTDEQLKEVEKLRSELNEAFEKHDEEEVAAKGVIVQPAWTQNGKNPLPAVNAKVEVTAQGIAEVKALRAEIDKAVAQDADGSTSQIKKLEQRFDMKERSKGVLDSMLGTSNDNTQVDQEAERVGSFSDDLADDYGPKIVTAYAASEQDIDIRKLQRLELSKRRTKEVLVLKYIEEDFSFDLGADVQEWEHILHDGKEFFIGRRITDLLIVRKEATKYERGKVLDIGHPIAYLETYSHWNVEQQQQEGVILVASADRVLWYRGNRTSAQIELYWEWIVGTAISGLTYFTAESNDYLAVSSNESSRAGYYALSIYQFKLQTKEFWIAQRMQLQYPCGEVTILDTGRDIVLAVAQLNTAAIYTFNPRAVASDHIRFQLRRNISSENIEFIGGFQMGGRSYLALGGLEPQILLYQQGDFVPKTILAHNFGLVELFFPIPVRTYRDDLILLVQHRVDFGTHSLTVLETLIWDGEAFEASIPVPCQLGPHTIYGVKCMLDIQRDEGLKGAALLKRGNEISVIVPRHNAESGLFRLHTELLARNSELIDLQEIFAFLQDWVKEQDVLIAQMQSLLQMPDATVQADLSQLELLKTPELFFTGNVGEIYVNDYKWTDHDTNINLDDIMRAIEQLDVDLRSNERQRRDINEHESVFDLLEFEHVEAFDLTVENVNNELFYIQNGALNFDGNLKLANLQVLDAVNTRESRQAFEPELEINGNLEFDEINGMSWRDIRDNLIFRNVPLELDHLEVDGEIIIEDNLTVKVLNSLNFPEDFLWSSGPAVSIVQAEKIFTGNLAVNAVDTDGVINGVNPLDAITLADPQDWTGLPTFANLEVSERLELNGTAHGRGLDNFPSNPTLEESQIITSACSFEHLEVIGDIQLNGLFDNIALSPLLTDVVLIPSDATEEIVVSSRKRFASIEFPIDFHILDTAINNISISEFVTLNTKQVLNISSIDGYMYFANLTINGTYDGVKIEEFVKNAVKIDEPEEALSTQLNFVSVLQANTVNILSSLNGVPVTNGYQTINEDLIATAARFEHLHAKVADMPKNIAGVGQLNGLNLREFLERRTWTEPTNTGNIFLDELILHDGLETDELHGIDATFLMEFLQQIDELPEMILDGKIQVDHVIVTGNVQVNKLNEHNFDEDIQMTAIWLNRPNFLTTALQFTEPLVIHRELAVLGDYNGHNLPNIIDNMIFRTSNGSLLIQAPKSFSKNVHVQSNTNAHAINSVPFADIANKKNTANFKGSLQLNGNLIVYELELSGSLNAYPLTTLGSRVRYDKHLHAFVMLGTTQLDNQFQIEDLTVQGNFNDIPNLNEFFDNLIFKNQICMLRGKNTFTGRVSIERGAYVRQLNGHNLLALFNNMVFIHETRPITVNSAVSFKSAIRAPEVTIEKGLISDNLNGCSLAEWLKETLRVDQHEQITRYLHFSAGSLNGNSLYASYLNNIDLSELITLHTEQNLSSNLIFSEIFLDGEINSNGLVNGVDLQLEFANTLLTYGDQHVSTPLTMQSINVLQNLQTNVPINSNKDLNKLARLNENLDFESPLFFQEVHAQNVQTSDLVSGVDLEAWFNHTLWLSKRPQQWISGNWSVRNLTVKLISPNYQNMDQPAFSFDNDYKRTSREQQDEIYELLCARLYKHVRKLKRHAYFVKHLEERFDIALEDCDKTNIRKAFVLEKDSDRFMLINTGCFSSVHKWNATAQHYVKLQSFKSGPIDHVVLIAKAENTTLQFVTDMQSNKSINCTLDGLKEWALEANSKSSDTQEKVRKRYAIVANAVMELSTEHSKHTSKEDLDNETENANVLQSKRATRDVNNIPENYSLATKQLISPSESILKPNSSDVRKLSFADFKQVVERIMDDLVYRLDLEVNVTQLSIPESDLYDQHLIQDFIAIMEELVKQEIFPKDTFANVNIESLDIPSNPAQVLAARTVQIIWPVIVEIEEVHNYLRANETHSHPICACITSQLGIVVRDVLLLANGELTENDANTKALSMVIERIREFQNYLAQLTAKLNSEIDAEIEADIKPSLGNLAETLAMSKEEEFGEFSATTLSTHLALHPIDNNREILTLQVGSFNNSRTLLASSAPKKHLVAGQHDGIKLYIDVLNGSLFQTVGAHKPRSLVVLRIRDETLLAYVENCCLVHVLIYRGVQGFVEFAKFKTTSDIVEMMSINLPQENGVTNYYLAIVFHKKITFYEVIIAGLHDDFNIFIPCN